MEQGDGALVTVSTQYRPVEICVLPAEAEVLSGSLHDTDTTPGHGGGRHLPVNTLPDRGHVLHGQTAGGAGVESLADHVGVAGLVEEVGAGRDMSRVPTGVDVLHADWAVVVGSVGDTFVLFVLGKAETAGVAVSEVLPTSDPAAPLSHITPRREFLSAELTLDTLHRLTVSYSHKPLNTTLTWNLILSPSFSWSPI